MHCIVFTADVCGHSIMIVDNKLHLHLFPPCPLIITKEQSFDDLPKQRINIKVIKILGEVVLEALQSNHKISLKMA